MTSWAVVCDVYFLEPQAQRPGEAAQQFAERVQHLIAARAKLPGLPCRPCAACVPAARAVRGRLTRGRGRRYLKYYTLGAKVRAARPRPPARLAPSLLLLPRA